MLGSAGEAESLLAGALPPEEAAEILSDVLGNSNKAMWDRLSAAPESALAGYLQKEHPQTFAFVLSKLSSGTAAKIMAQTPRDLRNSLMRRMLSPRPVMDPMMRLLEQTLHEDLLLNVARNTGADTHSQIADIINKMERDQIEDVLNALAEDRPKDAETLRGLLFTFEDIAKLSQKARTTVFDKASRRSRGHGAQGHRSDFPRIDPVLDGRARAPHGRERIEHRRPRAAEATCSRRGAPSPTPCWKWPSATRSRSIRAARATRCSNEPRKLSVRVGNAEPCEPAHERQARQGKPDRRGDRETPPRFDGKGRHARIRAR